MKSDESNFHTEKFISEGEIMKRLFEEGIIFVILAFVFFGMFPLVLFRVLAYPNAKEELEQAVKRNLEGVVHEQEDLLTLWYEDRKSHARAISDAIQSTLFIYGDEDLVGILNGEIEQEYLRLKIQLECAKEDYGYKGIFICDAAGIIHLTTENEESLKGSNIVKNDAFKKVRSTLYDGKSHISGVTHFSVNGEAPEGIPSLFLSYPIEGEGGDVIGAVLMWMDTSGLDRVMKNVVLGKTGEGYLINEDGVMITESRFSLHHMNSAGETCKSCHIVKDPDTKMLTKGVKRCITEKSPGYDLEGYRDYGGFKVVGMWRWLKELNMGMMIEMDADEALEPINNISWMIKSFMLVIIIPAFVIAALVHRKLSVGYMIKGLILPKKTLLGAATIFVVGFIIAIVDGYQLRKERGYIREQKYELSRPLETLGSIVIAGGKREEDFIKENILKLKLEQSQTTKTENTINKEQKNDTPANWEIQPQEEEDAVAK